MTIDSLQSFVTALDAAGELMRVRRPVSVVREITEIADRCMKSPGGGPALLFEQPQLQDGSTSAMPVAINLFGSMQRMGLALGVEQLDDIGDRMAELLKLKVPQAWRERLSMLPRLAEIARYPPMPADLRRLDAAFFCMNGVMSIVVALFALLDRVI